MSELKFHIGDILAFDLHTVVQPLGDPSMLQKSYQFLSDSPLYRKQYEMGQPVRSESFEISPFDQRVFDEDNFWNFYSTIRHDAQQTKPDYWKLQVPFACKLLKTTIKSVLADGSIQVKLRPQIFISAIGWSTTINIRLKGDMTVPYLIEFVGKLRGKASAGDSRIFELNGRREPLWKLYSAVQNKLFSEVYSTQKPPAETRILDRYILIAPLRFSGPIKYFHNESTTYPEMSDKESAVMLSILYGELLSVERFMKEYGALKFSVVEFHDGGPEFALSEFKKGAFVFMQETAQVGTRHSRATRRLGCFTSNIRTIVMMVMMLHHFCSSNETKRYAGSIPKIGSLLADVKSDLADLKSRYQHDFCKFLFTNYDSLRDKY